MKRILKVIMTGIGIGLVLLFFQKSFRIDEAAFIQGYWIAAPVIVIGAVLINICYNLFYLNKVKKSVKLLSEEKPQEYIDGISDLLKTAKGQNLRNVLTLNLAAGYVETKQFNLAIPMLEQLSDNRLRGSAVNVAHRINLCLSYFEIAHYDKAMTLYNENQKLFQKYKHDRTYGGNIAMLDVIAAIMDEQYDQAEELLDMARRRYDDSGLQKVFQELNDILLLRMDRDIPAESIVSSE